MTTFEILTDFTDINGNTLPSDTAHCLQLTVQTGKIYRLVFQQRDDSKQELSMRAWVSEEKAGGAIQGTYQNLDIISLCKGPTEIYVAEETANTTALGVPGVSRIDPRLGITIPIRPGQVIHQSGPHILVVKAGQFWINIQNYSGSSNQYILLGEIL